MEKRCVDCNTIVPTRKTQRCVDCKKARNKSVKQEPKHKLYNRWYTYAKRHYPNNKSLVNMQTVEFVLDRWQNKSVLSDENDINNLTIVSYNKTENPSINDLVLVTKHEAIKLNIIKSEKRRIKFFSDDVIKKIDMKI